MTEIEKSTIESNEEVTVNKSNAADISTQDFPETKTVEESAEELATVEKSTADKI